MAALLETCKPGLESLAVKERPKRDFLREHREYLRNVQEIKKKAKSKNLKSPPHLPNFHLTQERKQSDPVANEARRSEAFSRLTAKVDRSKPAIEKRLGTFISRNTETRKRAGAMTNNKQSSMCDQIVQTCEIDEEMFLEGAKIMFPSEFVLEAIRSKLLPPPPPKPRPVRRKVDRHTCVLNAHLSDLKEFLEKGSVSRRRKNETQKNPNIQKFLTRGRLNVRSRNSRSTFEPDTKKQSGNTRIMDNIKSSILFGSQGLRTTKPAAKPSKLGKIMKKETIGDGPKCSEDNKLIVVYRKK